MFISNVYLPSDRVDDLDGHLILWGAMDGAVHTKPNHEYSPVYDEPVDVEMKGMFINISKP